MTFRVFPVFVVVLRGAARCCVPFGALFAPAPGPEREPPGRAEELPEGLPVLAAHGAVQDEVDGAVEQRQDVERLAEQLVAAAEEAAAQHPAHQAQHALQHTP